uniref:Putative LOC100203980 [Hydra vulgaris] n=1 Tax=Lepeophtheirus salmonis TaxID=72036 RepID=A0A0K2T5K9_LEPSM
MASFLPRSNVPKQSENLNQNILEIILTKHSGDCIQVKDLKIYNKQAGLCNENFQSDIVKITAKLSNDQDLHLISKETMNGVPIWIRLLAAIHRPFYKEAHWYSVSLPLLSANWPFIAELAPQSYYVYINSDLSLKRSWFCRNKDIRPTMIQLKSEKGIILLENVTEKKGDERFKKIDVTSSIDIVIAKSALRSMGHFHGIWWQFLNRKNTKVTYKPNLTPSDFEHNFMTNDSSAGFKKMFKPLMKMYQKVLINHLPGPEGVSLGKRTMSYFTGGKILEVFQRLLTMTVKEQSMYKTMMHGDFWRNNLLYRPSDNHVLMIDYQGLMIAHPARDFWYFVYSCSDRDWRQKHLEDCKKEYFTIFSSYLNEYMDVNYEAFSEELEETRGFALIYPMIVEILSNYPEEINRNSFFMIGKDYKKMFKAIVTKETESDHPGVKRIRRRLIDTAQDLADLSII